jgi:hypothetical protein
MCDGGTGDEAVTSGDVAPAPVDDEPAERENAEDATPVDASVEAEGSGPGDSAGSDEVSEAPDGAPEEAGTSDEPASDEDDVEPGEQAAVEADASVAEDIPGEPESAEAGNAEAGLAAGPTRRLRPYLKRGAVALVAAGFVAFGVGAFAWVTPSPESANQRFVEAAQSEGHVVAPGEQETLVISAARKICDRRITHDTDRERRATALNSDEIAAVGTAFGADTRDFTTLALKTFCSS